MRPQAMPAYLAEMAESYVIHVNDGFRATLPNCHLFNTGDKPNPLWTW